MARALWFDCAGFWVDISTGDSLFPDGVGKTQQDPQRFASLIDDVEQRIFAVLPDDTGSIRGTATTRPSAPSDLTEWRERGW